ncbi:transcriptional regulator ATRX-like [Diabrotica virgifera virgifera]|uniref:FYVE-type domain-containing protein n=1 Tax=Diabrotica virgifera virgifera TaxID=50390 RepID=A0ABM5KBF3_DIAVI|nr:transcriptional regulator ATRX-like [Diabrotica virgifera virgifera]
MGSTGKCAKCNYDCVFKESKTELFGFPCDLCKRIYCKKCSNVSSSKIRVIVMVSRVMPFYCPPCRENVIGIPDLIKRINVVEEAVQDHNSNTQGKFISIEQRIIRIEDTINNLTTAANESSSISSNSKNVKIDATNSICPLESNVDAFLEELKERKKKSSNLIIYNLDESTKHTVHEKEADDHSRVVAALTTICSSVNLKHVFRLGKKTNVVNAKPRLIKVVLNSETEVLNILKNKNKVDKTVLGNLQIKSDLTKLQRDYLLKVRTELTSRVANGETNLTIRYIKGVPKIMAAKN